jgi:hypothetical protein
MPNAKTLSSTTTEPHEQVKHSRISNIAHQGAAHLNLATQMAVRFLLQPCPTSGGQLAKIGDEPVNERTSCLRQHCYGAWPGAQLHHVPEPCSWRKVRHLLRNGWFLKSACCLTTPLPTLSWKVLLSGGLCQLVPSSYATNSCTTSRVVAPS